MMDDSDRWLGRVAQGSFRSLLRHPSEFWGRQSLRQLSTEDRARLTAAQVVATRPAFTAVLAGGGAILALTGIFEATGITPGIGYPAWMVLAAALLVWALSWANWGVRGWRMRLAIMLAGMMLIGVFLSIPTVAVGPQLPVRTGLFQLVPIALLALTVRPISTLLLVVMLVVLTAVRAWLHGVPASGEAMVWLYTAATIVAGLVLSAYRTDFAVEAYRVRQVLWRQASTDALTGLLNRAGWQRDAARVHADAGARSASRSLVFFDVDHLKQVNDTWGHERGDSVLRILGQAISTRMGPDSYAARLGGEEFIVLMIDATPSVVQRYVHRVRNDFAKATHELGCTLSAGIAFADAGEDLATQLRRADGALYTAKTAGRDRICIAPSNA